MHRIFYCLLPLAAAGSVPAQAQNGAWRVSEVSGDVRIAEAGRSRAATRGALLSGGSVIAGARSRAVLVRGRQYMVVSPGSTVRVEGPAGGAGSIVDIAVEAGNALFKVDRRENPHFRVRTRFLAAVVRGTTFSVSVTPAGGTVQVTEGAVQVSTLDGGASDLIRPGMIASIGASDLYQLTISGDQEKVIRSPAAPAAGVTTPVPQAGRAGVRSQAQPSAVIATPVGEAPVRLSEATNGLVRGAPAINLALLGRGGDSADRNRGSGNDREGRDSRADRARELEREERNGRGNGNGSGRGDEADGGKDKDKDEDRPGNGNGGNEDDEKPGKDDDKPGNGNGNGNGNGAGDDDGKDKDKDEDRDDADGGKDKDKDDGRDGDGNNGHGDDDDGDDDSNPGNGGDKDDGGKDDDKESDDGVDDDKDMDEDPEKDRGDDDDGEDGDGGKDKDRGSGDDDEGDDGDDGGKNKDDGRDDDDDDDDDEDDDDDD